MIFSYNWLQKYIEDKLPEPKKLAKLLGKHSFEVEEVKQKDNDFILDIDVRPNRAGDCFSHIGVARECAAIIKSKFKDLEKDLREDKDFQAKDFVKIDVKEKACLRYTARVLTDIKVEESPDWLKEKLNICGLQPINNIVDAVNYVMLETGQPLHAFDLSKLKEKKIIIRFAKEGEKITSLDNQKFDLDRKILVIADEKNPIAIAGIKGGKKPEIDSGTNTIILESANFDSKTIRNASRSLKLRTDASLRFEHGLDANLTEQAINRAAQLIQEITKCRVASGIVDFYPRKILPKVIGLKVEKVKSLLGIDISQKEIIDILKRLGFKILEEMEGAIKVEVPTLRVDVSLPEDLIEDIGRIYGYENIPVVLPKADLFSPKRNLNIFWEDFTKNILKENGFTEIYNYSFLNQEQVNIFGFNQSDLFELENPLSQNQKYLCPSLIPNLLRNVKDNFRYFDNFNIFEIAKTFKRPQEKRALTGLIAQKQEQESFYVLKGVIDVLFEKMGIANYYYDNYQATPEESNISIWNIKKSAEIKVDDKEIGFIGYVSKDILKLLDIDGQVVMFDIDFEKLQKLTIEEHNYQPICPYPSAIRDLSILVPEEIRVVEILNIINRVGGELINDVDLFDVYENNNNQRKSLAFHIIYQAQDRTLSSKEIDQLQNKIVENLEKNLNWEVRK